MAMRASEMRAAGEYGAHPIQVLEEPSFRLAQSVIWS